VTSHPLPPGEGKIGRVNVSESLLRLRYAESPETVADQDGEVGQGTLDILSNVKGMKGLPLPPCGHQAAPE
jgi:hypothetical protein